MQYTYEIYSGIRVMVDDDVEAGSKVACGLWQALPTRYTYLIKISNNSISFLFAQP